MATELVRLVRTLLILMIVTMSALVIFFILFGSIYLNTVNKIDNAITIISDKITLNNLSHVNDDHNIIKSNLSALIKNCETCKLN